MGRASSGPVPVVVMGLGPTGLAVARAALASEEVELLGAVDEDPALAGRPLAELLEDPSAGKIQVQPDLARAAGQNRKGVLLLCTFARLPEVEAQILAACKLGFCVVSCCPELSFPWMGHPELASRLERAALRAEVAVLGTGVNPGFAMDRLVATLGQVAGAVRHAKVERVVDAQTLGKDWRNLVGAGLSEDRFLSLAEKDEVGLVGLLESAALAALGLGLDCDDFEEELLPVLAVDDAGASFGVKQGQVAGLCQAVVGLSEGQERIRLELTLAVGVEHPSDRIRIDADLPLELEIKGGVAGELPTAHAMVNAAPRVFAAEPGLLTVLELPAGR